MGRQDQSTTHEERLNTLRVLSSTKIEREIGIRVQYETTTNLRSFVCAGQ